MDMKKMKMVVSALLVLSIVGCLTGCGAGNWKDNLIDSWDRWIQSFSKHALTKERDLQGRKTEGVDAYTGTYVAAYEEFNGKEFLFGGTALNRENGSHLQVTYKLSIKEGTAELNWIAGSDEYSIAAISSGDTKEYTISSGDNYIVLKGDHFSGSLELTVKDVEN